MAVPKPERADIKQQRSAYKDACPTQPSVAHTNITYKAIIYLRIYIKVAQSRCAYVMISLIQNLKITTSILKVTSRNLLKLSGKLKFGPFVSLSDFSDETKKTIT